MSIIRAFWWLFLGGTERFSGKNGALRWSILVWHNVQGERVRSPIAGDSLGPNMDKNDHHGSPVARKTCDLLPVLVTRHQNNPSSLSQLPVRADLRVCYMRHKFLFYWPGCQVGGKIRTRGREFFEEFFVFLPKYLGCTSSKKTWKGRLDLNFNVWIIFVRGKCINCQINVKLILCRHFEKGL